MNLDETVNNKYYLELSLSKEKFSQKPANVKFSRISYEHKKLPYLDFIHYIQCGHCFCHVFKKDKFRIKDKSKENFLKATTLWVDIDEAPICLEEAWNKLANQPNVAYETMSNKIKGFRYRLVYFLDFEITSILDYQKYLNIILNDLIQSLGNSFILNIDSHCFNVAQQMLGTTSKAVLKINNSYIYSKRIFKEIEANIIKFKEFTEDYECSNSSTSENISSKKKKTISQNKKYATLCENVLTKYSNDCYELYLSNIDTATLEKNCIYSDVSDQNIYQIRFLLDHKRNKRLVPKGYRNKSLFTMAIIIRNIKPDISLDELATNLWWIFQHHMETEDMTIFDICSIADGAMRLDSTQVKFQTTGKRKYCICPQGLHLPLSVKRKELGKARQKKRNKLVLANYDKTKSIKENSAQIGISKSTIYKVLKSQSLLSPQKQKFLHFIKIFQENPNNHSIRFLMKLTGFSSHTVQKYLRILNDNYLTIKTKYA